MTHEPWLVVCPTTRRSLQTAPARRPSGAQIPPAPAIPRPSGAMPATRTATGPHAPVPSPAPATPPAPPAPTFGAMPVAPPIPAPVAQRRPMPPWQAPPPAPAPAPPVADVGPLQPARAPSRGLIGRVIGDRYGVTKLIGAGGMGEVYEAEHLALGRLVAVKVIHQKGLEEREASSRLRHEARVAGTLGHPNICAVHDMGRLDDGSPYLVMERLHGETLAQRLQREQTIPLEDVVDMMTQVLSALAAAHAKGVIHRDLKPDNIFLSLREGMRPIPKLLDFGISKAEDIEDTMADPMGLTSALGTPYYMAPEQARGDRAFDHRVDLWGVGLVLYECITGQRPFDARNYNALLVQIITVPHRPVIELCPLVPLALSRIVDRCLAKRAADRFETALDVQTAMLALGDLDPTARKAAAPPAIRDERTSSSDDSDSTFVFSRASMGLVTPAEPSPPPPPVAPPAHPVFTDDAEEHTTIYRPKPQRYDDERTMVTPPPVFSDPGENRDTVPIPPPKKR
ncbi:MAG: serine/threonine-protein kinase [Byssovorax sp.]